jgi:hypothetical protein
MKNFEDVIKNITGLKIEDALEWIARKADFEDAIAETRTILGKNFTYSSQPFDKLRIGIVDVIDAMKIAGRSAQITAYDAKMIDTDPAAGYASVAGILGFLVSVSPTDSTQPNVSVTLNSGVTEIIKFLGSGKVFVPSRAQATYDIYAETGLTTGNEPNILEFSETGGLTASVDAAATVLIRPVIANAENVTMFLNHIVAKKADELPNVLS